jgi:hypothetical protein
MPLSTSSLTFRLVEEYGFGVFSSIRADGHVPPALVRARRRTAHCPLLPPGRGGPAEHDRGFACRNGNPPISPPCVRPSLGNSTSRPPTATPICSRMPAGRRRRYTTRHRRCAIGSVVDSELKVLGLQGLRVVDASVMPTVVRGTKHQRSDNHDRGKGGGPQSRRTSCAHLVCIRRDDGVDSVGAGASLGRVSSSMSGAPVLGR